MRAMLGTSAHFDPPLKERLRFSSGTFNTLQIVDDRALMARTFAYLFGIGGTLALLTLLLPGSPDRQEIPLAAAAVAALLAAGTFVLAYDRLPPWLLKASPMLGNLLVALASVVGGVDSTSAYAVFYFWVALAAFCFFELRRAMLCGAAASA